MTLGFLSTHPEPMASTRKGITWGHSPPSEPASVLVLVTPSSHFVDIRFPLEGDPKGVTRSFAGKVKYTPIYSNAQPPLLTSAWGEGMYGSWTHNIDSLGKIDKVFHGDLFVLKDGHDQIEVGLNPDPETGETQLYKEYWTYPESPLSPYPCIYVEHAVEGRLVGMIVRVGRWAQGIRQMDETSVQVVRMELKENQWVPDSGSSPEAQDNIPVQWAVDDTRQVGEVHDKNGSWTVRGLWHSQVDL